jgi:hypothetical protein
MLRIIRMHRARQLRGEEGMALAVVIGIVAVLMITTLSALTFSVSSITKASTDVNADAATAAAYAGVSDYEARLTNDNTYEKYGDSTAPFSVATGSTTLALPPTQSDGTPGNPAFGTGKTGTWASVPAGQGVTANSSFRYEVDNSDFANEGVIRILVTGRAGKVTRSFLANVHQNGFLNYVYFTDFEELDPYLTGVTSPADCLFHYGDKNPAVSGGVGRPAKCGSLIQFNSSETIDGAVDSNDALNICGGTFTGLVTSNYLGPNPLKDYITTGCSGNTPPVFKGKDPISGVYAPVYTNPALPMPPTNKSMEAETYSSAPRPGCLYTGPTSIVFNSGGTMTVRSPYTVAVQTTTPTASGASTAITTAAAYAECGTPGTSTGQLGSTAGQTVPVPDQNLIFVQNVPGNTLDANYPSKTAIPPACATNGNDIGYPIANENVLQGPSKKNYYGCTVGDAFVKGTLKGHVTIATDNFLWITGDIKYSDTSSDVLGLVGNSAIYVWNPTKVSTSNNNTTYTNLLTNNGRTIDAALMSVGHTFQVQNYDEGSTRGSLNVLGAVAQEFRGTVGTTGSNPTGYSKQYSYDKRFLAIAPPKFLQAVSTTYGISQIASVPAAFNADGSSAQ